MLKLRPLHLLMFTLLGLIPALGSAQELPFEVTTAESRTVPVERVVDAVVEAVNQSTVSAQTSGRIEEINFDVDDFVPKGSVLVRFHDTEQRAALEQAQASLEEARARLTEAEKDFKRTKEIYEKKLVSKAKMDSATANRKAARARLESAQASVRQAKEQLEHTVVRAPYAGVVLERHVEIGEMASPGQPLMTGFSFEHMRAVANVPQVMVGKVRHFGEARVLPDEAQPVTAKSISVLPYADATSHTFKVRVELPTGVEGLYPGMFVKAAFRVGERTSLLVPTRAVVQRSEVRGVYVVNEEGQVSLRQVRLGRHLADGSTEVLAGLDAGERIAVDPVQAVLYLKEQQGGSNS